MNQYESAIISVGEIIQDYDSDQLYPGFGFGGIVEGKISHKFHLNFNPQDASCAGIEGVLEAYRSAVRKVTLCGPTNFQPVIKNTIKYVKKHADGQQYFVLLIITDGIITDMQETMEAVIEVNLLSASRQRIKDI